MKRKAKWWECDVILAPRYLLFMGLCHFPDQGWRGFVSSSNSTLDLVERIKETPIPEHRVWGHIVDTQTEEIVIAFVADGNSTTHIGWLRHENPKEFVD